MNRKHLVSKHIQIAVLLVACHISCAGVDISVKDDIRASAAYRRAMVEVLTRRGIEAILAGAGLPNVSPAEPPTGGAA
jgi:hypothetical protein